MNKKINILHINNSNILSQYLLSIGRHHDGEKFNLTIACFDYYGTLNIELEKMGVNTFNIPVKKQSPFFYLLKIFTLYKFIKNNKIEILHVHTFFPSFFGVIVGKMAGVKQIIMTRHHADTHVSLNKKLHTKIDSWTARNCNKIIAVSEFTKQIMIKYEFVPENKIRVIHNGIEPLLVIDKSKKEYYSEFNIDEKTNVFLCISRLHEEKNIETALKALKFINDQGFNSILLIAGAGINNDYHNSLKDLAKKIGITDKLFYLGFRNDIGNLLLFCDALIHSSLYESFGFSVLEAMSMKKTIFVSNIPAFQEVATSEVANFFEPSNDNELSQLLLSWLNNKEAFIDKQIKGLERCENHFTLMKMISKYEKYYEEK